MSTEDLSDLKLPGEHEIISYCRDHACEVKVPLETVYFIRALPPTDTPLHLHNLVLNIKVSSSRNLMPTTVELTQEEITGFLTGQTTSVVQEKIRVAIESVLSDLEEV
jgi:hypothetical protein